MRATVLDEWHWTEQLSPQPETLHDLDEVAEKSGLREHMQSGCRVDAVVFDEQTDTWTPRVGDGRGITTHFVATAVGVLPTSTMVQGFLLRTAKSWITGYNSNIEVSECGKIRHDICNGGVPKYATRLGEVAGKDNAGAVFT